jgi:3',5'-cyclic AMP phosphodiesterase CpdA
MRILVHLSDLHFGRVDPALLEPLRKRVIALAPHVVVVSGDLTQRAKPAQFREARAFLDTLPANQVVVPGNHDVPLYNVFQRFAQPLAKYRRYIASDLEPAYVDEEIAVVGINTARSLVFKGGRINAEQLERVRARLCHLPDRVVKIIVTHHPFDLPQAQTRHALVGRAAHAMKAFASCGADIVLSGHLHARHTAHSAERYRIPGHSALIVQAGTATSTRGRGEANGFNALTLEARRVVVESYEWRPDAGDFVVVATEAFEHSAAGWRPHLRDTNAFPAT